MQWRLVVPVKGGPTAKSRLAVPGVDRLLLAQAFALDTLEAACACVGRGRVYAVTPSGSIAAQTQALGARLVKDPGEGLDAAIAAGLDAALRGSAGEEGSKGANGRDLGVGVLLGDLPALTPGELATALGAAAAYARAFVPDHVGTGTVLLTARAGVPVQPLFGPGSAARHERSGATRLELDLPRLRTDVDDLASLRIAAGLGLGARARVHVADRP